MSVSVEILDEASPVIAGLTAAARTEIAPALGAAVVKLFQQNFLSLGTNKQGWPSTGFWAQAARSCNYDVLADSVAINVDKQGVRQRLEGGEIHAEGGGYLTIPARAEAYGKRAREFSNLVPAFFKTSHGFFAALVEARSQSVGFGRQKKDGTRSVKAGDESGGGVFFWLKKSVNQKADPSVIPSDAAITATVTATATGIINRAIGRGALGIWVFGCLGICLL